MTLTLQIPDEDQRLLVEKAQAAGIDVETYVQRIVHVAATEPPLDEVLRPIRDAFNASGMTEDELGEMLEKAKHEMRAERRAHKG